MSGKGRGISGLLVGLAGAGLMGWGLANAVIAPCVEPAEVVAATQSCSSNPPGWVALAMGGGVILSVTGMFMGGGLIAFSALFVAIGLGTLIPTWLGLMPNMEVFGWTFGGGFVFFGLLPFVLGIFGRRMLANKQALAEELMRSGTKAIGTIVEVKDTGSTINDNPRVDIRMRVAPLDNSPPVERHKRITASRVAIPRAGERYPVWFDREDPEKWMFATAMDESAPADVRDMFARCRAADEDAADEAEDDSAVGELAKLTELWKDGALTDAEFADAKARLLPRIGR